MKDAIRRDLILVGAIDPLPPDHFWFEGDGFSIYAAKQPRSGWREHTHECVKVIVGLEPAHMHAQWRKGDKAHQSKEFVGNAVSVIPAGELHQTMWQRRAALIHFYLEPAMLQQVASDVLIKDSYELLSMYLVRDPLIEELAREVFSEFEMGVLNGRLAQAVITVLSAHVLRVYSAQPEDIAYFAGGLGPARERRVREYIEQGIDGDLSVKALAQSVGLSVQHFAALFRASTGFTPHQYVNHRRVEHAQRLLADLQLPLVEVAYRSGFSSQSQFITLFRRFVGLTPGRYRSSIVPTPPD